MSREDISKQLDAEIRNIFATRSKEALASLINAKLSHTELLSHPGCTISSALVTDIGILIKVSPETPSIVLSSLPIDDKFSILESITK